MILVLLKLARITVHTLEYLNGRQVRRSMRHSRGVMTHQWTEDDNDDNDDREERGIFTPVICLLTLHAEQSVRVGRELCMLTRRYEQQISSKLRCVV